MAWSWPRPLIPPDGRAGGIHAKMVCTADDGNPLSGASDASNSAPLSASDNSIPLVDAQEMSLEITTYFEGGKSMNYQALAGDFDGQGTSFGLIQWNFGSNTLGPLLKKMLNSDPDVFAACFGPDADYDTLQAALAAGNQADELQWARDCIQNNRVAWQSAFKNIGANAAFNQLQREQAAAQYHPKALNVINDIRQLSSTLFTTVEFRSYAAIFDLCVQQGSLHEANGGHKALDQMKARVQNENPATQLDLMQIVVKERGLTAASAWRNDCISRRMGILAGASYKSTEGQGSVERKNPQFSLVAQFGTKNVQGL